MSFFVVTGLFGAQSVRANMITLGIVLPRPRGDDSKGGPENV